MKNEGGNKRQTFSHKREKRSHHIPPLVSMDTDRFLGGLEHGRNNVEPKSREMPCSSMSRNVRGEPRAKKIRKLVE